MSETAAPDNELLGDIEEAMRDVVDPELGINVVDLGLVYGLSIEQNEDGTVALIDMNGDGKLDIACGRNWYEAPNWVKHTNYRDGAETFGPITDDGGDAGLPADRRHRRPVA